MVLVRSFVLTEAERKIVRDYIEDLPERMPGRIKRMRSRLSRTADLEEMKLDIELLEILKGIKVPIGRIRLGGRGESWRDQRAKFAVRPRTES